MEVVVEYKNRDLQARAGQKNIGSLSELVIFVAKNKEMIDKITISGNGSYTFSRQIYLFANLIAVLTDIKVRINGQEVIKKPVFPTYG